MLLWLRMVARKWSYSFTEHLAHRYGENIGFLYVGGYPKSGTSWIAQMVAHVLDLPLVKPFPALPITFRSVIHHHWDYHPALDGSIYVVRDGRDVMVSSYMAAVRTYRTRKQALEALGGHCVLRRVIGAVGPHQEVVRCLDKTLGRDFDADDVRGNLPRFIRAELDSPIRWAVDRGWKDHVSQWLDRRDRVIVVKYEDMLDEPVQTLHSIVVRLRPFRATEDECRLAVDRYRFSRVTGRAPGTEDRRSFARKGIAGDWKSYFNREAAQAFEERAGRTLEQLGYVKDNSWVNNLPEQ